MRGKNFPKKTSNVSGKIIIKKVQEGAASNNSCTWSPSCGCKEKIDQVRNKLGVFQIDLLTMNLNLREQMMTMVQEMEKLQP